MKKAVYRLILFAAITAFVLSLSPSVKAEPNDTQTKQNQYIASDTKPLSNADKPQPAPHQKSDVSKENSQLQLAKEQLRGDFYKDSQDNLKLALGIIVTFVIGLILYTIFKDRKEYEKACENAEKAYNKAEVSRTQAKQSREKAREHELKAQEKLASISQLVGDKLKEIDTKAKETMDAIKAEAKAGQVEIEKIGNEERQKSLEEAERQRKISELWNEGLRAEKAGDYESAAKYWGQIETDFKVESPSLYCGLGTSLSRWGLQKKGDEVDKLLTQGCEKFEKAVQIKPDYHEAYNNWGNVLLGWGEEKEGEAADKLFTQACEKYEKAIQIKQDKCEAYNNWGVTLSSRAEKKQGGEADKLFTQACEKYEKALKIKQDYHGAYNNWGNTLSDWAQKKENAEADKIFTQACEKYEKALQIKQDYHEAYDNWGNALVHLAKLKGGKDAENLLKQAEEKCLKAESIKTGAGAYNLACVYALRGNEEKCKEWLKVKEKAETLPSREHAMADDDLKSVRDKNWFKKLRWKGE